MCALDQLPALIVVRPHGHGHSPAINIPSYSPPQTAARVHCLTTPPARLPLIVQSGRTIRVHRCDVGRSFNRGYAGAQRGGSHVRRNGDSVDIRP
jgi:hypothetical protein